MLLHTDTCHLQPVYTTYKGGIGGPCARYDPPFSYWCSSTCSGGGAHITEVVRGVVPAKAAISPPGGSVLAGLHLPYKTMEGAIVNAMHEGRWANWMWEVATYDPSTNNITFGIGGFQESRGSLHNSAGDWFVENVLEELDAPNEFFFSKAEQKLYYVHNGTGPPPATATYEVPQQRTLFNLSSSRWRPIDDVTIRGLTLTATRYTYMDPHGVPSAGDFAIARSAAVFLEGTRGVTVSNCNFTRLDGNALLVSGFNRNATVATNTFSWIGDNAVIVWGKTNETAANPLEGFDGTDGNHPQFTRVSSNVIREIGIYEKQSGWFFQAKAAQSLFKDNLMWNAPRNGITFNDPFAGGDLIKGNLAFSALRETEDGGTYNSWDRQPYLTTTFDGSPSPFMAWRELSENFFINNYHMEMNIDTDDGTSYVEAHHNVLMGGEWAMKSDQGGHDNWQHDNLNVYASGAAVELFNSQQPGHEDRYWNNTIIQMNGSVVSSVSAAKSKQLCGMVNVTGTKVFCKSGVMSKCPGGLSLADTGTGNSVAKLPEDDDVVKWARTLLKMKSDDTDGAQAACPPEPFISSLISSLNFSYPGLEPVGTAWAAGHNETACAALVQYYRTARTASWLRSDAPKVNFNTCYDGSVGKDPLTGTQCCMNDWNHICGAADGALHDQYDFYTFKSAIPRYPPGSHYPDGRPTFPNGLNWGYCPPPAHDRAWMAGLQRLSVFSSLADAWNYTRNASYATRLSDLVEDWVLFGAAKLLSPLVLLLMLLFLLLLLCLSC